MGNLFKDLLYVGTVQGVGVGVGLASLEHRS